MITLKGSNGEPFPAPDISGFDFVSITSVLEEGPIFLASSARFHKERCAS
jgi:hypothetical protein